MSGRRTLRYFFSPRKSGRRDSRLSCHRRSVAIRRRNRTTRYCVRARNCMKRRDNLSLCSTECDRQWLLREQSHSIICTYAQLRCDPPVVLYIFDATFSLTFGRDRSPVKQATRVPVVAHLNIQGEFHGHHRSRHGVDGDTGRRPNDYRQRLQSGSHEVGGVAL